MPDIENLLAKYKKLKPLDQDRKEAVLRVIKEKLKLELDPKSLSFSGIFLHLKASPRLKSEIFIHKPAILGELKKILGNACPKDIK